jgi:hypothetical protein
MLLEVLYTKISGIGIPKIGIGIPEIRTHIPEIRNTYSRDACENIGGPKSWEARSGLTLPSSQFAPFSKK